MPQPRLGEVLSTAGGVLGGLAVGLLALKVADAARRQGNRALGSGSKQRRGAAAAAEPPSPGAATPALHFSLSDIARLGSRLEALYMPAASLAELSDCWLAVEGRRLPAHSQVLAAQAGVLRDFVLTAHESGLKATPIDLTAAFAGSSLPAVTCLLHFLYYPSHADAPTLAELEQGGQLAAVARLAHKLDAAAVLQAVECYLLGVVASVPASQQVETLQLAEDCQLESLRRHCVSLLAAQLAAAGPFWRDVLSADALASCRSDSLAELACQLAESVDAGGFAPPRLFDVRHAPGGGAGGFTMRIDDACWRLANRCAPVLSPWVNIGGFEFRVWVYLNGNVDGAGNSVSVYLYCNTEHAAAAGAQEVQAAYEFEFLDRGPHRQHLLCTGTQRVTFDAQHDNWGRSKVASIAELQRADRAYIVDDTVTLRVGVRVATPPPQGQRQQQQPAAQVAQAQLPQVLPQVQPPQLPQGPLPDALQQQGAAA